MGIRFDLTERPEIAMELSIEATYENGVLKPVEPLPLAEHERVCVVVRSAISRARQTAGLMGWTGDAELADRFATDAELEKESGLKFGFCIGVAIWV
jgi:predicted DNA-binding antitoxin AbrB/MazE fold protein